MSTLCDRLRNLARGECGLSDEDLLQAADIIDRLPVDANGNPMTGCEDVWVLRPSDGEIYQARTYGPYPPAAAEWAPAWGDLHASRELAEKARQR